MFFRSFYTIIWIFCQSIVAIQSAHYVYTYANGTTSDEHCCLVRSDNKICSATPLTSRLIQINKQCQPLETKKTSSNYLDQIVRRLNIEETYHVAKKTFIQLNNPLSKEILQTDLLCLSSKNNHIELDRCFIETIQKTQQTNSNETVLNVDVEEIDRVQLDESILIRQGEGLSIVQSSTVDRNIESNERRCWDWYRQQTKKLCQKASKHPEKCIDLDNQQGRCLETLVGESSSPVHISISLNKMSKLFCENNNNIVKLLGYYRRSRLCFQLHDKITVEHQFTDLVQLSEQAQNKDILKFIASHDQIKDDFQRDCNDYETLVEISETTTDASTTPSKDL